MIAMLSRNAGKKRLSVGCSKLVFNPLGVLINRYVIAAVERTNIAMDVMNATLPMAFSPLNRLGVLWKRRPRTPVLIVTANQAHVKCLRRSRTGHLYPGLQRRCSGARSCPVSQSSSILALERSRLVWVLVSERGGS